MTKSEAIMISNSLTQLSNKTGFDTNAISTNYNLLLGILQLFEDNDMNYEFNCYHYFNINGHHPQCKIKSHAVSTTSPNNNFLSPMFNLHIHYTGNNIIIESEKTKNVIATLKQDSDILVTKKNLYGALATSFEEYWSAKQNSNSYNKYILDVKTSESISKVIKSKNITLAHKLLLAKVQQIDNAAKQKAHNKPPLGI